MNFAWIKALFPKTLYARAAVILILPVFTLQLAVTITFFQRHFEGVTEQMTNNLIREIAFVLEQLETRSLEDVSMTEAEALSLTIRRWDSDPSGDARNIYDMSGRAIIPTIRAGLPGVRDVDLSASRWVVVAIESPHGPLSIGFARSRVSATNPHQVLVWMLFTALVITLISVIFMRNQLRPIRKLSSAAEAFGKGQVVPLSPRGAVEVRAASQAFLDMRSRIERQIEQRTLMLSGVSHDLRTPLTRMQLQVALMEGEEVAGLKQDIDTMRDMIEGFLGFAADTTNEPLVATDVGAMLRFICDHHPDKVMFLQSGEDQQVLLRPLPIRRAVENLVQNALRYGSCAQVSLVFLKNSIRITVEDDGPGIAKSDREDALRPFVRLDRSRNQDQGGGVGLGLAIVVDIARTHGGSLTLGESIALGGLQAEFVIPKLHPSEG